MLPTVLPTRTTNGPAMAWATDCLSMPWRTRRKPTPTAMIHPAAMAMRPPRRWCSAHMTVIQPMSPAMATERPKGPEFMRSVMA